MNGSMLPAYTDDPASIAQTGYAARVERLAFAAEDFVVVLDSAHHRLGCAIRAQAVEIDRLRRLVENPTGGRPITTSQEP